MIVLILAQIDTRALEKLVGTFVPDEENEICDGYLVSYEVGTSC